MKHIIFVGVKACSVVRVCWGFGGLQTAFREARISGVIRKLNIKLHSRKLILYCCQFLFWLSWFFIPDSAGSAILDRLILDFMTLNSRKMYSRDNINNELKFLTQTLLDFNILYILRYISMEVVQNPTDFPLECHISFLRNFQKVESHPHNIRSK
jgi:hypothetical protein